MDEGNQPGHGSRGHVLSQYLYYLVPKLLIPLKNKIYTIAVTKNQSCSVYQTCCRITIELVNICKIIPYFEHIILKEKSLKC